MKLDVSFSENNMGIDVTLPDEPESFDPNMGEVVVIHGKDGATFTPYVSSDGIISWTNDRDLQNPIPVNIKGVPGKDGKSTYEIALENGFVGTEAEWLESLGSVNTLVTLTTYDELKALVATAGLIPGMTYRITDYVTTSAQENTRSAGHPFDIIVQALSEDTLSETATAIQQEGDEHFADSNLSAWNIWYTLDNDTTRFAWADAENGKGVIYRMIDEWDNDCPYDFKNIQMLDANNSADDTYYYTFDSNGLDHSLNGSKCFSNVIKKYIDGTQRINRIIFKNLGNTEISTNFFDFECYNNTLGSSTDHLKFGRECYGNVLYGMNHLCAFDTKFRNNTVGSETQSIQVGQGATGNTFAANIYYCSFGNYFRNNVLCKYLYYSSFGHYVQNIILGQSNEVVGKYMRFLTFENNVQYVNLYKTNTTTSTSMENVKLCSGTVGTSASRLMIEVSELAQKYAITYAKNSSGELVKYCDADGSSGGGGDVDMDEITQYVIDKLPIYDGEVVAV